MDYVKEVKGNSHPASLNMGYISFENRPKKIQKKS